jgi:6-phosphogluconolactonase
MAGRPSDRPVRRMAREILIFDDEQQLAQAAADLVAQSMRAAVESRGRCSLALAGGSTPRLLYEVLASERRYSTLPWMNVDVFWGDERTVPPDHVDSNYRMALETLLSKVPTDPERVHRILAEHPDPHHAAALYEGTLRGVFELGDRELPRFDLILLGMGADGHTASLFPASPAVDERSRLVTAAWSDAHRTWRVTMTLPVLNAGAQVTFMVSGEGKAAAVAASLAPPADATPPPAALVQPVDGRLVWLLDRAAARHLSPAS